MSLKKFHQCTLGLMVSGWDIKKSGQEGSVIHKGKISPIMLIEWKPTQFLLGILKKEHYCSLNNAVSVLRFNPEYSSCVR